MGGTSLGDGTSRRANIRGWTFAVLALAAGAGLAAEQAADFPPRLQDYLTDIVRLIPAERQRLLNGEPVTRFLSADPGKEIAILGAVWVDAPMRRYVEAIKDIEAFERGAGVRMTQRISDPPRPEDFSAFRLSDEDLADLRTCRVGACNVTLGEQALMRFRSDIEWSRPTAAADANALMRRLAFDYVTRYRDGGNQQLAVYRDSSRPTFVAREFQAIVDQMPELSTYMPNMRRYLLEYPRVTMPDATSMLYWQETDFGLKPTIKINHLTVRETVDDTVVAAKMLYASHYFWTGLELRVLIPDPSRGAGFWFVTVNRSRSDGLGGTTGPFVRRRVRGEVQRSTLAELRSTKQRLERPR